MQVMFQNYVAIISRGRKNDNSWVNVFFKKNFVSSNYNSQIPRIQTPNPNKQFSLD
jgi:hypothetical protein